MPRTGGLATPSMHPYRPFAAAEAAADRHRVASTATRLLRGYYEATTRATTRLLYEATTRSTMGGYYEATTRLLRGYYEATTRLLRGYYEATTWLLRGYYEATTRLLPGYYRATNRSRARATWPAAPQQQHSSSASARPLIPGQKREQQPCASSSNFTSHP